MSEAHLHRYVDQFAGRYNIRPLDTAEQMGRVVDGMVGMRLTHDDLIAAVAPAIIEVEPFVSLF